MSTPRFADPATVSAAKAQALPHRSVQRAVEDATPLARDRARGLHAAYAQCAALRRMFTSQRVIRLLLRWRMVVWTIACEDEIERTASDRLAIEDAIVEEHRRAEAALAEAGRAATQSAHLSGLLRHKEFRDAAHLSQGFASWRAVVQFILAEEAVAAEEAAKAQANRTRDTLRDALSLKTNELAATKKMVQRPTMLERELSETSAELAAAQAHLSDLQKKLREQQRRSEMAEERVASLQREVQEARTLQKRRGGGGGGSGSSFTTSSASAPASGRAPRDGSTEEIEHLRASLASSIGERQTLNNKLDGQRAKVQALVEARHRGRVGRAASLMQMRCHMLLMPALRRWQAASLAIDSSDMARSVALDTACGGLAEAGMEGGHAAHRQSRIIGLQVRSLER